MHHSDPFFGAPEIFSDEWLDQPIRHRRVRGSFQGTDTRFLFLLPDPAHYQGRFIQFLQGGMGGSEIAGCAMGAHRISFDNRGMHVESNQGHIGNDMSGIRGDNSILAWRASAQTARLAREMAREMYGEYPHHGYLFGGSGGGLRGIECMEAKTGLWDGAVPFIANRNGILNFNWSIAAWAGIVLADRVPAIVDALDAGGNGDPFSALTSDAERHALATLYRAGYCRGAESQLQPNPLWVMGMNIVRGRDAGYFEDFWNVPGYAGADGDPLVQSLRLEETVTVTDVYAGADFPGAEDSEDDMLLVTLRGGLPPDARVAIRVDSPHTARYVGAMLTLPDGRRLQCSHVAGQVILAAFDPKGFVDVAPGTKLTVDNRDLLAFAWYHRHFVGRSYPELDHFFVDGHPLYPQRARGLDRVTVPKGDFEGRMILIQNLADRECWPNCAAAYDRDVRARLGAETDRRFRLWWIERAAHLTPVTPRGLTRLIDYAPSYAQGVSDVIAWVEEDVAPPASTRYTVSPDSAVVMPSEAEARRGIQPVVAAHGPDGTRLVTARPGESVCLTGHASVPAGSGTIVHAEWDTSGAGDWAVQDAPPTAAASFESRLTHRWDAPGSYFVTFRAGAHREDKRDDPLRTITNLARVRVIVR